MAKIEITDYETTKVTEEEYECDRCGVILNELDMTTVTFSLGPPEKREYNKKEVLHLCEECSQLREALQLREEDIVYKSKRTHTNLPASEEFGYLLVLPVGIICGLTAFIAGALLTGLSADPHYGLEDLYVGFAVIQAFLLLVLILIFTFDGRLNKLAAPLEDGEEYNS